MIRQADKFPQIISTKYQEHTMSCLVLNESDGKLSNNCLANKFFQNEDTSLQNDSGK